MIDVDKVIPERSLSVYEGAVAPLGKYKNVMIFWQLEALLERYEATLKTPVSELPEDAINEILYGCDERLKIKSTLIHATSDYFILYEGIVKISHSDDAGKGSFCHRTEMGGTVC